jgi:signal transduction histidine kinase
MDGQATKMTNTPGVSEPFRALVDQANAGIAECNLDGTFLYANTKFCQLAGRDRNELSSLRLADVVAVREASRVIRPDGSSVPVHLASSTIQNSNGEPQSTSYIVMERVDQKQVEKFLFKTLHDLRSPLGSASNLIQVLLLRFNKDLPKEAAWVADQVYTQIKRLNALLNAIGQFVDAGSEQGATERVELEEALRDALESLATRIQESGADISTPKIPSVTGHRHQLVRLFENIIGNSITYRGSEPLRITITSTCENGRCTISVRDNGLGFNPEYVEKIFIPFERLHGNSIPGSGLGLSTARRIVENHGGRIWAESQDGQGAAFFFTLPTT